MSESPPSQERRIAELDENIERIFEIRKRLGKGAYGIVWKATDRRTNETIALKKIFDAFRDETDAQRTYREIIFLRAFQSHPNIIRMLDIYKAENNLDFYLVFEYMDSDLHNVIKKGDILKDVHKRFVMYQLLNAIKFMHSGNVIHRDLKPSNILIDTKCRLKVADFGLARTIGVKRPKVEMGGDAKDDMEQEGILTDYVATRWYRAPEILVASKRYTKGIDMWSLGCILGEMLRRRPLFQGTSTVNQIERIISALPEVTSGDIQAIGASFGTVLLSKKITQDGRQTLDDMLRHCAPDAVSLVKELLVFDPDARLTAKNALRHTYVERFHTASSELEITHDIVPALSDDVRVSVNEYRAKLYEMVDSEAFASGGAVSGTGSGGSCSGAKRGGGASQSNPRLRLRSSSDKMANSNNNNNNNDSSKAHHNNSNSKLQQPVRVTKQQTIQGAEGRRQVLQQQQQQQQSCTTDNSSLTYRPNKHNYTYTHTQAHAPMYTHAHTPIRKSYRKYSVRKDNKSSDRTATNGQHLSSNHALTLPKCNVRDNGGDGGGGGTTKTRHVHAGNDQPMTKSMHFTSSAHRHWQQYSNAHEPAAAKSTLPHTYTHSISHQHKCTLPNGARTGTVAKRGSGAGGDDGIASGCSPNTPPRRRSTYVVPAVSGRSDTDDNGGGGGGDTAPMLNKELTTAAALGSRRDGTNQRTASPEFSSAKCLTQKANAPADNHMPAHGHPHLSYFPVLGETKYGRVREIQLAMEKQQHVLRRTPTPSELKPKAGTKTLLSSSKPAATLLPSAPKHAPSLVPHANGKYEYKSNYNDLSGEDRLLRTNSPKDITYFLAKKSQQKHECNKGLLEKRETFVGDKTAKHLKLTPQGGDARYAANLNLYTEKTQQCVEKEKRIQQGSNELMCKGTKTLCTHHYHQRSQYKSEREHEREREYECCERERKHERECAHERGQHQHQQHNHNQGSWNTHEGCRDRRDAANGGRQLTREEDRQLRRLQKEEELEEQRRLKLQKQKRDEELRSKRLQKQDEERQRLRELKKREEEERMERVKKQKLQESENVQLLKQQRQQEINLRRLKLGMQREEEEMIRQALQASKEMRQQLNALGDTEYHTALLPPPPGNIASACPGICMSTRYAGSSARCYCRHLEQKRNSAPICYNSRLLYLESEVAKYKRDLADYVEDSGQYLRDGEVRLHINGLKADVTATTTASTANQKVYTRSVLQYNVDGSCGGAAPQKSPDDSGICSVEHSLSNRDDSKGDLHSSDTINKVQSEPNRSVLAKAQAEMNSILNRLVNDQHDKTQTQQAVPQMNRHQYCNMIEIASDGQNELVPYSLATMATQWAPNLSRTRLGYLQPGLHRHDVIFLPEKLHCSKHSKDNNDARVAGDPGSSSRCDGIDKNQRLRHYDSYKQKQQQQQQQQQQHCELQQPQPSWEVTEQTSAKSKLSKQCSKTAAEQCYFDPNAANRVHQRAKTDDQKRAQAQKPTQLVVPIATGSGGGSLANQRQSTYSRCQSKQANRG